MPCIPWKKHMPWHLASAPKWDERCNICSHSPCRSQDVNTALTMIRSAWRYAPWTSCERQRDWISQWPIFKTYENDVSRPTQQLNPRLNLRGTTETYKHIQTFHTPCHLQHSCEVEMTSNHATNHGIRWLYCSLITSIHIQYLEILNIFLEERST